MPSGAGREVWIPGLYFVLVAGAAALPAMTGSAFSGIWCVLLTLPWAILMVPLLDALGPDVIDRFGMVALLAGGAINASALHYVLRHRAVHLA